MSTAPEHQPNTRELDSPKCSKSPDGSHDYKYWKGRGDLNVYKCSFCNQLSGERL